MTNYPSAQDNNITLPGVSGVSQEDIAISALRDATFAIEKELGITPSGVYTDVRARLDILESRINFSVSPTILNDGYVNSPLIIVNQPQGVTLTISDGYGAPTENRVDGSLYMRGGDGYANNQLYVRLNAAWKPIQTDQWTAGGDLSGTYLNQEVIGIRHKPVDVSLETIDGYQDGYHLTWSNTDGYWRAETGFLARNDLAPAAGSGPTHGTNTGRTAQTVVGIQNSPVSNGAPSNDFTFVWEGTDAHWEPQAMPIVFGGSVAAGDGYITRTNIRSNRLLQSPMANNTSKVGMINFGSRSTGLTTGTTDNYAAILSGDQGSAGAAFALIVGGQVNISSGINSSVLNGVTNQATQTYATVLGGTLNNATGVSALIGNGTSNTVSGSQSFIIDGYSNLVSATNAFVLNGGNNQANANLSSVLNGLSNTIASGNTHAGIGFGSLNTITGAAATYAIIMGGSGNTTSAQNAFIGNPTNANVQSNYGVIISGIGNTISTASTNAMIVNGNNVTATGLYATVLNATGTAFANGLHSLILNGNTNQVTGTYSTIGNGLNNTISGNPAYATILDGYSNTVTSGGGLIVDGYSNTVNGIWSSIINGNNNSISGRNSTILNGSSNTMDAASSENTILVGTGNSHISTNNTVVIGSGNTLTNVSSHFVLGSFNNHQSTFSFTNGSLNTSGAGSSFNRIFGSSNTIGANVSLTHIFGNSNTVGAINSTSTNNIIGSNNIVDGYGNSNITGANNIANAFFTNIHGQYGKSRMYGQEVRANARFTPGKIGEAQWSRLILDGYANSGAQILLQLQDTSQASPSNPFFLDGYSYDMQIRVMIVNTAPISPNPVVPARYVIDVLAHQEAGVLTLDNVNYTVSTPNTVDSPTRTPWTVTLSTSGNQLVISADAELASAFVQPSNTASNRRAIATIEMREMSRL